MDASGGRTEKQDVAARMRDGVKALARIEGLSQAVSRLSGRSARDLWTRDGIAAALAKIRRQFPAPTDTRLRLRITTRTPPEAAKVIAQVRAVLEKDPTVGILRERWPARGSELFAGPDHEVSGGDRVPTEARDAWNVVASIAVACRIQPRSLKSARALALAGARALCKLERRQKPAVAAVAALPRVHVLNADAAAVAFAHAPREGGAVAVVVVETTAASVWRTSEDRNPPGRAATVAPRSGRRRRHGGIGESMRRALRTLSDHRGARSDLDAGAVGTDRGWLRSLCPAAGRDRSRRGRGSRHMASLGAEEAAQLAAKCGRRVQKQGGHWLTREPESDADQGGAEPSLAALAADGEVTQTEMERFRYRLAGAVRRTTDAAILALLAGLPSATAELARLIRPITTYDPASNRKAGLGRQNLDAAVAAAAHSDPAAMVRAVASPSTRALVLAAALCGPWKMASEAIASGDPPWKALLLFASAAIERPLSRAAAKSLSEWPLSPWRGLLDVDERFKDFSDLATLAAVLWAETPNRPAMTTGQLCDLRSGLRQFGFVAPSVAGPCDRTWDDPATAAAYAAALRRGRHDLVGSAGLGSGVVDMIRFLDGRLASLRLTHPVGEAVRRAILVPPGRLVPGLERLSDRMHRSIARMTRERHALSQELIGEEAREKGGPLHEGAPEDFPNPLTREIVHAGVTLRPLRRSQEIDEEAIEMASCVSTYRDEARVGDLLLYRLRSDTGGSTLGLDVRYDVNGVAICIFQHYGPQHTRVDAPPPPDHRDAASWLLSLLERPDGALIDREWRNALYASRRAHARHARVRPSERDLSPTRQRRLAVLDLTHLGCLLGANERTLDLDAFRVWAESLVES